MAGSHHSIITHALSETERRMVDNAVVKAAAPSAESALLGAVRLLEMLKDAGLVIPDAIADEVANPMATLDDWNVATDVSKTAIIGTVSRDPTRRHADGKVILTSRLVDVRNRHELRPGSIVRTRHVRYRLGRRATSVPAAHRIIAEDAGCDIAAERR